jgi:hypothetical protein
MSSSLNQQARTVKHFFSGRKGRSGAVLLQNSSMNLDVPANTIDSLQASGGHEALEHTQIELCWHVAAVRGVLAIVARRYLQI